MSHYPLFADLRNRPVLLAGAGKVAERKAESLLSAGARVRVVAETLNPQFQQWAAEGKIVWLSGLFEETMLDEGISLLRRRMTVCLTAVFLKRRNNGRNCAIRWIRRTCVRLSCLPWWIGGR